MGIARDRITSLELHGLHSYPPPPPIFSAVGEDESSVSKLVELSEEGTSQLLLPMEQQLIPTTSFNGPPKLNGGVVGYSPLANEQEGAGQDESSDEET